jgi:regulator of replication initiation timing
MELHLVSTLLQEIKDSDTTSTVALITAAGAIAVAIINAFASASRKSVKKLKETISAQGGLIDDMQTSIKGLRDENTKLRQENASLRSRLESLEDHGRYTANKVKSLEKDNRDLTDKIEKLREENSRLEQENAALRLRIEQLENNKC